MKCKAQVSTLVCLALIMSLLGGIVPFAAAEEAPTEISIALWEMDASFVDKDDAVYKQLCDKFNIKINPIPLTWDDYGEKVNTWIATDDMPDVFNIDAIGSKNFYTWVREELVRPLPEDMSAYPNLQKVLSLPDVAPLTVDGKFWCLPRCKADLSGFAWAPQSGCYYRKDWAAKLGLKEPTTAEEFVEFARAMVNGDPDGNGVADTVGITSYDWGFLTNYIWGAIEPRPFASWQLSEDGKASIAYDAEHTYDAALAIRNMYNEGLIDPDIAIQDTDAGFVKFATNKAAILPFQMYQNDHYIFDKFTANNPGVNIEDAIGYLKPLVNTYDGKYYFASMASYWSESYISYKVDDAKMDKILQLLNYCAGDEWIDTIRFGIEGVDYQKDGENVVFLTEDGKRPNLLAKYPFLNGFKFLSVWDEGRAFFDYATAYPYSAKMINEFYDWTAQNGVPKTSTFAFTMIQTPLRESYVDESSERLVQFMFGKSEGDPQAEWTALVEALKANGIDEMVKEVEEAARTAGVIK